MQEPAARIALHRLSSWLERAVLEGRAALRFSSHFYNRKQSPRGVFANAFKDCGAQMELNLLVSGVSREMHPIARDECLRIGHEAILNACNHSRGNRLSVELVYDQNMLLRIQDDGEGIDPEILQAGKSGHYGLIGMRERAARIGAKITVVSSTTGTIVTLFVPGEAIFIA